MSKSDDEPQDQGQEQEQDREYKYVQTRLPAADYNTLTEVATTLDKSITEIGREAIEQWLARIDAVDSADPLFASLDRLETAEDLPSSAQTDARTETDIVDEWGDLRDGRSVADPTDLDSQSDGDTDERAD